MQKCNSCGADLPENARFCGKCGSVQDTIATDAGISRSTTLQPQSGTPEGGTIAATWSPYNNGPAQGSASSWSVNMQEPTTPPPPFAEDEDERKRGIPPWSPLYGAALVEGALLDSGQVFAPGAPVVQGTPQIGSVPGTTGSSTLNTNAPISAPKPGAGSAAPASHPVEAPGNAPVSHPTPVRHPVQGPAKTPISHPVQKPQPIHQPPEQPGTQGHPPIHKHHRHHEHEEQQHEPERRHTQHTQHEHHSAARVSKLAGGSSVKTIMIVVTTLVVIAAGGIGAAIHFLSSGSPGASNSSNSSNSSGSSSASGPQPLISITSKYMVGNTPAGASGTTLHISGQNFSSNSAITFLLDDKVAPGNPSVQSDANGSFSMDVTITDAWSVGTHTLTAKDASNHSTKNSVSVTIVQSGQANTPGPNGAPPDDATFTLTFPVNGRNSATDQPFTNNEEALQITGHPDPAGGTVCLDRDNGQQISGLYVLSTGVPFRATYTFSCQGSYKNGKISFTETILTALTTATDGSGSSCTLISPQTDQQVTGSYTGNNTFTGTWTYGPVPASDFSCTNNWSFSYISNQGSWTGTVSGLQT